MSLLSIKKTWVDSKESGVSPVTQDELQATHARVEILLGKENITEHKSGQDRHSALEIPLYYLAEWLAENWWVLLFESQKGEDDDDPEFIARHSIISAQHGFPLPALTLIPFGRSVRLNCRPRRAPFADVMFTRDTFGDVPTEQLQETLFTFIQDVDARLRKFKIENTNLQLAAEGISNLGEEERVFCELLGALGLSPACATEEVSSAVEELFEILGPDATRDYCFAARADQILQVRAYAEQIRGRLPALRDANLEVLLKSELPPENLEAPSYRRGMQAAKNVREKLKINTKDERGADKVFEALDIDLSRFETNMLPNALALGGAIDRDGGRAKIALFQDGAAHRRFSAGRAAYLGWVSESRSRRLITNAVTRDQQASRQFAAEILVPQEYLKYLAKSSPNGTLGRDHVHEIAGLRGAMPDVALKQAYNAGIRVAAI